MKKFALIFLSIIFLASISFAQIERKPAEKKQFIYVLHLVPKFLDLKNWSDADNKAIDEHFARLQKMHKDGSLILAGKTENWDETMFGIVVYEADSMEKAKEIAETDPAVVAGVMTVKTFPYKTALLRGEKAE
ncbi:MAG: hypothetical protein HYZ10_01360 [Ignavibacteriales bacterium]|nr:MAG: hypothetical protein FD122_1162 [Stygiobacter sp.]KAF0218258.1 MAG: hypothetical protein FD178_138 [Ignavibacteria bacterium]MBI3123029.1 hypothetical protein [Ignavibacteriales bacterium]